MYCCQTCFSNKFIKEYIESFDEKGTCEYCYSENQFIIPVQEVGNFIRGRLDLAYESVVTSDLHYQAISNLSESVKEVLLNNESVFSEVILEVNDSFENLYDDLFKFSGPSIGDLMDGEVDYWEDGYADVMLKNEFYAPDDNMFSYTWNEFKEVVKHKNRFFDIHHEHTREDMLNVFSIFFKEMEEVLSKKTELFRVRLLSKEDTEYIKGNAILECGPPPPHIAKSYRMSPAGISYFYGAEDIETSKKEVKYTSECDLLIGKFKLKKPLKVVNLSKFPLIHPSSIFSDDYNHELNWAQYFLDQFIEEVSKPINKYESEIEYIPTQIIAEYIRLKGYDGVIYKSSLTDKRNYTLFCGRKKDEYSLFYDQNTRTPDFTEWMELMHYDII